MRSAICSEDHRPEPEADLWRYAIPPSNPPIVRGDDPTVAVDDPDSSVDRPSPPRVGDRAGTGSGLTSWASPNLEQQERQNSHDVGSKTDEDGDEFSGDLEDRCVRTGDPMRAWGE
jgi:hypothetical protein